MLTFTSNFESAVADDHEPGPFEDGLRIAFGTSLVMCLIAAWASWKRGGKYIAEASPDDDVGAFGAPGPAR